MGLFSKKETAPCPVCGGTDMPKLFKTKIANGDALCKDCISKISLFDKLRKVASAQYIKEHLEYREKNKKLFDSLNIDVTYDIFSDTFGIDTTLKMWYFKHSVFCSVDNPPVFRLDEIAGYELYRSGRKIDDDKAETNATESLLMLLGGEENPNYELKIKTTNQYWPNVDCYISLDTNNPNYSRWRDELGRLCSFLKTVVKDK